MELHPAAALALVALVLGLGYGVLHFLGIRFHWAAETKRKGVHVALGLVCLTFPWLFESSWPVTILGVLAVTVLAILRFVPRLRTTVASDLHEIDRFSLGELFFPVVVAWCFYYAGGDKVLYVVPVAVLTLADAGGALMGLRFGTRKFSTLGSAKSVEGSLVFFLVALLCVFLPLLSFTELLLGKALVIACILAALATLVEGFASHGSDNLLLPIACLLILEVLLGLPLEALLLRLGIVALLVPALCLLGRFTSLDGGGILGACLFGYACYALGNFIFLIAGLSYFAIYLATTCWVRQYREVSHSVHVVALFSLVGLVWLSLHREGVLETADALRCFLFGLGAQIALMHCGTMVYLSKPSPGYILALAKGALFVHVGLMCSSLVSPYPSVRETLVSNAFVVNTFFLLGTLLALAILYRRLRGTSTSQSYRHQLQQSLLALPFSALGLLV